MNVMWKTLLVSSLLLLPIGYTFLDCSIQGSDAYSYVINDRDIDHYYNYHTSCEGNYAGDPYNVGLSYTVGTWPAYADPTSNNWILPIIISGVSSSGDYRNIYGSGLIRSTAMEIDCTSSENCSFISFIGNNIGIWSTPSASSATVFDFISEILFDITLSLFPSYIGLSWSIGAHIIDLLKPGDDTRSISNNYAWRQWNWRQDISETAQQVRFNYYVNNGHEGSVSMKYLVAGLGYEILMPSTCTLTCSAPNVDYQDLENMDNKDLENLNIQKVSRSQLVDFVNSCGLEMYDLCTLLSSDKEYFYFTNLTPNVTYDKPYESLSMDEKERYDLQRTANILKFFESEELRFLPGSKEIIDKYKK